MISPVAVVQRDEPQLEAGGMQADLCDSQRNDSDSSPRLIGFEESHSSGTYSMGKNCFRLGDEGLLLKVKLDDKDLVLLVDTGSDVSVLTKESYGSLPEAVMDTAMVRLKAVNGGTFSVEGKVAVHLDVSEELEGSIENFLVADISKSFDVDGILGRDILKPH